MHLLTARYLPRDLESVALGASIGRAIIRENFERGHSLALGGGASIRAPARSPIAFTVGAEWLQLVSGRTRTSDPPASSRRYHGSLLTFTIGVDGWFTRR